MRSADRSANGIECPSCGSRSSTVRKTANEQGFARTRKLECHSCDRIFYTVEVYDPLMVKANIAAAEAAAMQALRDFHHQASALALYLDQLKALRQHFLDEDYEDRYDEDGGEE
jgi:transcriptional regulator NrdR family protein